MDACLVNKVNRLVFTSSYNAIFSNYALTNVDENVPYPDDSDQLDYYSISKKKAEILVLKYDNTIHGSTFRPIRVEYLQTIQIMRND